MIGAGRAASSGRRAAAATHVAPAALAWLRAGRTGRVSHVFDRVAYLTDEQGEILLVASPPVGMGPFSLLTEDAGAPVASWLSADDAFEIQEDLLVVGRVSIPFDSARLWDASPDWDSLRHDGAPWRRHLPEIRQCLLDSSRGSPFAQLLNPLSGSGGGTIDERIADLASRAAVEFLAALAAEDEDRLAQCAVPLAGLGHGFTPSGDDFLMGAMFALWSVAPPERARRRASRVVQAAEGRTTLPSAAWLAAAGRGEAAEPWHVLIHSLTGASAEGPSVAAARILRTGHTSGEDALIGFVRGLEMMPPAAGRDTPTEAPAEDSPQ